MSAALQPDRPPPHDRGDTIADTTSRAWTVKANSQVTGDVPARAAESGTDALAPGSTVDHYLIKRRVGQGGMGTVYCARDTQLDRDVALKVIKPKLLGSARTVAAFLDEARVTARFNHPYIVTVYAVGEHQGQPYLALEWLQGENLAHVLAADRAPLSTTLERAECIARAIAEAHHHGVLHRDLKPGNVMVLRDGSVRVLDFGLAKPSLDKEPLAAAEPLADDRDYTHAGAGTPAYMSPEQWRHEPSSAATDVWAFGVLLFEMVMGSRPFQAATRTDLENEICSAQPAPRAAGEDIPEPLTDLIADCLQKPTTARPSSEQLVAMLARLRHTLPGNEALEDEAPTATKPSGASLSPGTGKPFAKEHNAGRKDAGTRPGEATTGSMGSRTRSLWLAAISALMASALMYAVMRAPAAPAQLTPSINGWLDRIEPPSFAAQPMTAQPQASASKAAPGDAAAAASGSANLTPPRPSTAVPKPPPRRPFKDALVSQQIIDASATARRLCASLPGVRNLSGNIELTPAGRIKMHYHNHGDALRTAAGRCMNRQLGSVTGAGPFDGQPVFKPFAITLPPRSPYLR